MTAYPAALPVLAEAVETVGDEIGYNTTADAEYIARHLDKAGFDIVPRLADPAVPLEVLTEQQRELVLLIALGLTDHAIGSRLFLAETSVKSRVKRLFEVLGARSRQDAVWCAIELGHITAVDVLAARLQAKAAA
jgi:DNA-binding NarL/FixJ family response regulator